METITAIATTVTAVLAAYTAWKLHAKEADVLKVEPLMYAPFNDYSEIKIRLSSSKPVRLSTISSKNFQLALNWKGPFEKSLNYGFSFRGPKDVHGVTIWITPLPKLDQPLDLEFDVGVWKVPKRVRLFYSDFSTSRLPDHGAWPTRQKPTGPSKLLDDHEASD